MKVAMQNAGGDEDNEFIQSYRENSSYYWR